VRNSPFGSHTTTHLISIGAKLDVYQRETPEKISKVRLTPSYQMIWIVVHLVDGSAIPIEGVDIEIEVTAVSQG